MESKLKKETRKYKTKNNKDEVLNALVAGTIDVKKKRSCLMCGKMFNSSGPGNRRCPKCSRLVDTHVPSETYRYKVVSRFSDQSSDRSVGVGQINN